MILQLPRNFQGKFTLRPKPGAHSFGAPVCISGLRQDISRPACSEPHPFPLPPVQGCPVQMFHAGFNAAGPSWRFKPCGAARRKHCAFLCGNFVRKNGTPASFLLLQPGSSRGRAGCRPERSRWRSGPGPGHIRDGSWWQVED